MKIFFIYQYRLSFLCYNNDNINSNYCPLLIVVGPAKVSAAEPVISGHLNVIQPSPTGEAFFYAQDSTIKRIRITTQILRLHLSPSTHMTLIGKDESHVFTSTTYDTFTQIMSNNQDERGAINLLIPNETLGKRIARYRKERLLTQVKFAAITGSCLDTPVMQKPGERFHESMRLHGQQRGSGLRLASQLEHVNWQDPLYFRETGFPILRKKIMR